jgi:hypothetical protein
MKWEIFYRVIIFHVEFEVLTAVIMKNILLWVVEVHWCLRGTLVDFYQNWTTIDPRKIALLMMLHQFVKTKLLYNAKQTEYDKTFIAIKYKEC